MQMFEMDPRNDLTARDLHKYEGCNICTSCHDDLFRWEAGWRK